MNKLIAALRTITSDNTGNYDEEYYDEEYPLAGEKVDGLEVTDNIPNRTSISATFTDYKILDGVREISMEGWNPKNYFYAKNDFDRSKELAEEIKRNGWIDPLIIAIEANGNDDVYILEGGHRLVALHYIGAKAFPALVVIGYD